MRGELITKSGVVVLLWGLAVNVSVAKYSGGTGEPNSPYRIETAEDLNDIGNHVEELNGKEVLVRIYDSWEENRSEFQEVYIRLEGNVINFDFSDIAESTVGIVLKGDQEDKVVRKATSDEVRLLRAGGRPALFPRGGEVRKFWTFKDGAGSPLSLASGEIFQHIEGSREGKWCASFVLDDLGRCRWRYTSSRKTSYYIVLWHPDYGEHRLAVPSQSDEYEFRIPVVLEGTEAYERSIRGLILDDANNPIVGALIQTKAIYPPGGQTVYVIGVVRTDKFGWFHVYPPIHDYSKSKIGKLIPPNSCYLVRIEAPAELGLAPAMMCIPNDSEQVIRMKDPGYFHTIAFEDADGRITDRKRLVKFHLQVSRSGIKNIEFEYDAFKNGRLFPLGTYRIDNWERDCKFEPIEVTAESPEELLFKTKHKKRNTITYAGRVVHGITGEPMQGAFVIAPKGAFHLCDNFSQITQEQWDALHSLGDAFPDDKEVFSKTMRFLDLQNRVWRDPQRVDLSDNDMALAPILMRYSFDKGVRTDTNGRFEIFFEKGETFHSIIVFEEDYLGIKQQEHALPKPDTNGLVRVPTIPLFPAAKVIVEPYTEDGRVHIVPEWIIDTNDCPVWVDERYELALEENVLWPDEHFDIEPNSTTNWGRSSVGISPTPSLILMYMLYDFLMADKVPFFGIPITIRRSYSLGRSSEPVEFGPRQDAVLKNDSFAIDVNNDTIQMGESLKMGFEEEPNKLRTMTELGYWRTGAFTYNGGVYLNRAQTIPVPAGVNLRLQLHPLQDLENKWVPVTIPQTINLKQGEIVDLGSCEIKRSIQVLVKVVDLAGNPVEGIPVDNPIEQWKGTHSTDANGITRFNVYSHSKGEFSISCRKHNLRETIPYEIGGEEDAGIEFTITISDKMLEHFFK